MKHFIIVSYSVFSVWICTKMYDSMNSERQKAAGVQKTCRECLWYSRAFLWGPFLKCTLIITNVCLFLFSNHTPPCSYVYMQHRLQIRFEFVSICIVAITCMFCMFFHSSIHRLMWRLDLADRHQQCISKSSLAEGPVLAASLTWPASQSDVVQIPTELRAAQPHISGQLISIDALIWRSNTLLSLHPIHSATGF